MTHAARAAEAIKSGNEALVIALLIELAGRLDTIIADDTARRVTWAEKKRRQRMSPRHRGTSGDIGGQTGTSGDISAPLPLASPTPTTTTTTKATTTTSDEPPSRSASRRGRADTRSSAVRQTWLTPSADVWVARVGAFAYGKAAGLLGPLYKAGLSGEEIATRLSAYLDTLDNPVFASLARFAETHAIYANGRPVTSKQSALDAEYAALAAEANDVGRMRA